MPNFSQIGEMKWPGKVRILGNIALKSSVSCQLLPTVSVNYSRGITFNSNYFSPLLISSRKKIKCLPSQNWRSEDDNDLPLQVRPFPEYPGLHVQLYDPLVLLHTALALQLCDPLAHSSMSEKKPSLT